MRHLDEQVLRYDAIPASPRSKRISDDSLITTWVIGFSFGLVIVCVLCFIYA